MLRPVSVSLATIGMLLLTAASVNASSPDSLFIEVSGVHLQYLSWGGTGEPLVLVPGGCDTAYVFGDLAPLLTAQFRVIGLTPRGCGQSGPASDGYGIDRQIDDLIGLLDALRIDRATFAGHSSGGGKVVRLARRYAGRVNRIVTFDTVYSGVPDKYDSEMDAAIAAKTGSQDGVSLESFRRTFQAWELGTWSDALEREFQEQTEAYADGSLIYRPRIKEWQSAFVEDMTAGRYFETAIKHPALLFVAQDLDLNRIRQFSPVQQRKLRPMAQAIVEARRRQINAFQQGGPYVKVKWMKNASHYFFVNRAQEVASEIIGFLQTSHPPI